MGYKFVGHRTEWGWGNWEGVTKKAEFELNFEGLRLRQRDDATTYQTGDEDENRYAHKVFENLWEDPFIQNKVIPAEENQVGYMDKLSNCQESGNSDQNIIVL